MIELSKIRKSSYTQKIKNFEIKILWILFINLFFLDLNMLKKLNIKI